MKIKFAPDWAGVLSFSFSAAIALYFGAVVTACMVAIAAIVMLFKFRA